MLLFLYFLVDGLLLFALGYFMGRVRPMKRLGIHFSIERQANDGEAPRALREKSTFMVPR